MHIFLRNRSRPLLAVRKNTDLGHMCTGFSAACGLCLVSLFHRHFFEYYSHTLTLKTYLLSAAPLFTGAVTAGNSARVIGRFFTPNQTSLDECVNHFIFH